MIKNAEEDISNVQRTMERLHAQEDQLVGDVCNHLVDVQPLVTMLANLTDQIRELEKYSQYLHCLAQIEDLRFLLQFRLVLRIYSMCLQWFDAVGPATGRASKVKVKVPCH